MRTVRRLFHAEILSSVLYVTLGFLALFYFVDFVDELGDIGKAGYTALDAALYTLLRLPSRAYELIPITVLIGTIFALARLAQTSQYTILRTSGLGPGRALGVLAGVALLFGVATFLCGDYLAPASERWASQLRGEFRGGVKLDRSGAWLKERTTTADGPRMWSVNIGSAAGGSTLARVRIFEFDGDGRLVSRVAAERAEVADDGTWQLQGVERTDWAPAAGTTASAAASGASAAAASASASLPTATTRRSASGQWNGGLSAKVVAAAVLPITTMSTLDLWRYIGHLSDNEQTAQEQKIQFWKRALYPLACFVMVALALPFAYLGTRTGGVSLKVFAGILVGVSFFLLNAVFRHLGLLANWTPWVVAAAPGLLYLGVSLLAFNWLVRNR